MPEKPQQIDVFVTSFRLVRKDDKPRLGSDPSDNVKIGKQSVAGLNSSQNRLAYDQLKTATQAGGSPGRVCRRKRVALPERRSGDQRGHSAGG